MAGSGERARAVRRALLEELIVQGRRATEGARTKRPMQFLRLASAIATGKERETDGEEEDFIPRYTIMPDRDEDL